MSEDFRGSLMRIRSYCSLHNTFTDVAEKQAAVDHRYTFSKEE